MMSSASKLSPLVPFGSMIGVLRSIFFTSGS
jgi:hypothetical protein